MTATARMPTTRPRPQLFARTLAELAETVPFSGDADAYLWLADLLARLQHIEARLVAVETLAASLKRRV